VGWGAVEFDETTKMLTVPVDIKPGMHFKVSGHEGLHPVHHTVLKTYRNLHFFQHECHLQVCTARVKLPSGSARLVEPDFAGRLSRFTLLFDALVLMLAHQMAFAALARIVGESAYRCMEVCNRHVEMALGRADFSDVTALAIDETSRARGDVYVTFAADAQARRVIFVTEGRGAKTIEALATDLLAHGCRPDRWETLRQACLNPEGRVSNGKEPPIGALPSNAIRSIPVSDAPRMSPATIERDPGFIAINGARGSGKTALVDFIGVGG
jgi:transposase